MISEGKFIKKSKKEDFKTNYYLGEENDFQLPYVLPKKRNEIL